MARGRMLNNKIGASLRFQNLPDDTCRLLATWTISHLDKNGVFYADPALVKSYVFPRRSDIDCERVAEYLQAMEQVGLIVFFEARGEQWQYWPGFTEEQPGLRSDRETTTLPTPPATFRRNAGNNPADCRQDSGDTPAEVKLSEGNVTGPESGADAPSPTGDTTPPVSFQDWQALLSTSKNKASVLHELFVTLYPGRAPPDYSYLGRAAKKVGGAGRLADLLWQNSTRPPTGDILAYCMGHAKGDAGDTRQPQELQRWQ